MLTITGGGGDRWAEVTVHDDGPGVPAELRDAVFDRFARADAVRTSGTRARVSGS